MWKKTITGTALSLMLISGLAGAAFAADTSTSANTVDTGSKAAKWQANLTKMEQEAAKKGMTLEQWLNARINVRAKLEEQSKAAGKTVEQYKADQKAAKNEAKLEAAAAKKGITVDQLKAQRAALVQEAKEKGITVKELLQQQKADHEAKAAQKKAERAAKKAAKEQAAATAASQQSASQPASTDTAAQ